MTDTPKLKEAIKESGLKLKAIASTLGISSMSLSRKVNNITEFKASEIAVLGGLLNLDAEKERDIFFADYSDL